VVWFLLPLNLCLIPRLKDRGVSRYRLWYPLLLLAQLLVVDSIQHFAGALTSRFLSEPIWGLFQVAASQLAAPVQFAFGSALLMLGWKYWRHAGPLEGNLLAALGLIYLAGSGWTNLSLETCLTLAGFCLTIAVIETSHSLAYRDELTGLAGRRALNETLEKLPVRYTLAMLDIDHFKSVNDRHGHDIGDQVLKMVAARLQQAGRPGRPFRFGGEEFTLLFPGKCLDDALPTLEKVRKAVAVGKFILRQPLRPKKCPDKLKPQKKPRVLKVTISIGAAEAGGGKSAARVLKKADQALYRAKQSGRNRVIT
jgi:diguanylate cyclase (GGDEF)-like protein